MNRTAHVLSAAALALMLVLAAGSQKPTPGELEAGAAAASADKKLVLDYADKMGAVYTLLAATDGARQADTRCDGVAMLKKAPPGPNDYGVLHLPRIYGPYLARFTSKNAADWKKYDYQGEWDWLTDSSYGGHFDTIPSARTDYAVSDTARRVKEEFIPNRYAVIVWPAGTHNRMPIWHSKTDSFDGGFFDGTVYVVDVIDKTIQCHSHVTVASADAVSYRTRGLLREKPESALKDDFENRMKDKLTAALPEKVNFGTMGTIF
jgi:hypothetical protein